MKNTRLMMMMALAAMTGAAQAQIVDYNTGNTTANSSQWQIGGTYSYPGSNSQIGFFGGEFYNPAAGQQMGRYGHQIGYLFTDNTGSYSAANSQRMATVTSFTINGTDNPTTRAGLEQIKIYYGRNQSQTITMPGTPGSQTYTFGTPIETSYLYFTVPNDTTGKYVNESGFGGAGDIPFSQLLVNGTWGDTLTNVNAGATMSSTGGSVAGSDASTINGTIFTSGTSNGRYWARDSNEDSITATYSESKTIDSIGLGLSLDVVRAQPGQITVSYDGGSEVINLRGDNLSYGVYDLAGPITTSFLTITMPDGTKTDGWFHSGDDQNYGITEFQAFAVIPEPSSLILMVTALGAVVFFRRRRR